MDESNELHAYLSGNLTMIIPKKHVISLNDIAPGIRTIYLKFNLLTVAKTKYGNRKMWKFFFISPIYPICEKKVFISLISRRFAEK